MRVGVISDTHGLLRPEAISALCGVEHILHSGDVGNAAILDALAAIAPVTAIRGNVDTKGRCGELPETEAVELGGKLFYLVHSVRDLQIDPKIAGIDCVVSGHSHMAQVEVEAGVTYLNPGSAGPLRFSLPVTMGLVTIMDGEVRTEIIELSVEGQRE